MIFGHKRTVFSIIAEYRIVNYRILTLKRPFLNRSYRNIFLLEIFFQRFYRDFIKVEKRRRQNSVRLAYRKSIVKMFKFTRSARCDNGNTDAFGDSSCKLKVVALFCPSQSILVKSISPAPRFSASVAQRTASIPVGIRPPFK